VLDRGSIGAERTIRDLEIDRLIDRDLEGRAESGDRDLVVRAQAPEEPGVERDLRLFG
jgi:hypothetical protein